MARLDTLDPLRAFKFVIEIDGFAAAGFDEVTGLEQSTEIIEHSQGGDLGTPQKLRGRTTYPNVTMKRGQTADPDFLNWAKDVYDPALGFGVPNYRREFDIVQFNEQNIEVKRWTVQNAWPVRFKAFSDLNGGASEKSVEELEVCHEGFVLA